MKIIAPNANTSVPQMSKILCVYRPYPPAWHIDGQSIDRKIIRRIFFLPLRWSFIRHWRANPQPVEVMVGQAMRFIQQHAPSAEIDLLYVPSTKDSPSDEVQSPFDTVWIKHPDDTLSNELQQQNYDTILMLYPDNIGAGWKTIEQSLASIHANKIIINGRERIFFYDKASRAQIKKRRFLFNTMLTEIIAVPTIWLVAFFLAIYDSIVHQRS